MVQPRTGVPARAWLWRSIDVIRAADLRADRCFQGLQPMTAAGGRKNDYPGECRAFPQGTPAHFEVRGTGISFGCRLPPRLTWVRWVVQ
jgi:hypothetical protein